MINKEVWGLVVGGWGLGGERGLVLASVCKGDSIIRGHKCTHLVAGSSEAEARPLLCCEV